MNAKPDPLPAFGLIVLIFTWAAGHPAQGAITVSGDITPEYDGEADPWEIAGGLRVGNKSAGAMGIDGGSTVSSLFGTVGRETGAEGTVTVSGESSTWINSEDLAVGLDGTGTLNISSGGRVASAAAGGFFGPAYIGANSGSAGTVTVTGTGSRFTSGPAAGLAGQIQVGRFGTGMLTILDGGAVSGSGIVFIGLFEGSNGEVTVSGADSQGNASKLTIGRVLNVGRSSTGTLNVLNGGRVENPFGNIGAFAGSSGTVNVTGEGSQWIVAPIPDLPGSLRVGLDGEGTMTISGRGYVENMEGAIGRNTGSQGIVTVTGEGSIWKNKEDLAVGHEGTGVLSIEGGGEVESALGWVGRTAGSSGQVRVEGEGSSWINLAELYAGYGGIGSMSILNGGRVENTDAFLGHEADSRGLVFVSGALSTWNTRDLNIGMHGEGTLLIDDGGWVLADSGWIGTFGSGATDVTGFASLLSINEDLNVGQNAHGTLLISDGATVQNETAKVGVNPDATGEVVISGGGTAWEINDTLVVGAGGLGHVDILDFGGLRNANAVIGSFPDGIGRVFVGSDSYWDIDDTLIVGDEGAGRLQIEDDGQVTNRAAHIARHPDSVGVVTVHGEESLWDIIGDLHVGFGGEGEFEIGNGALVSTTGFGAIGTLAGASGEVIVAHVSSAWEIEAQLFVGMEGTGRLDVADGGSVSNLDAVIGRSSGANGAVLVHDGSVWTNSGVLIVGEEGTGTLQVHGVSFVTNTDALVGQREQSSGAVWVEGFGAVWDCDGDLHIGFEGEGELNILDRGKVENKGAGVIGTLPGSAGQVTIDGSGSTWQSHGSVTIGTGGSGTLTLRNGALALVEQGVTVGPQGTIAGNGTIVGNVTLDGGPIGPDVTVVGRILPSGSTGTLTIDGDFEHIGGVLEIKVGGSGEGQFDVLRVTGNAILGGELRLTLLGGFLPDENDTFRILDVDGAVSGAFANITSGGQLETLDGLGSFEVHYGDGSEFDPNQIVLTRFQPALEPPSPGIQIVVATGDPAPDGDGAIRIDLLGLRGGPLLNNAGQIAFGAGLTGTSDGSTGGLFRADANDPSALVAIARGGETVPGGNGMFPSFMNPTALNTAGQVAFAVTNLAGTSGGSNDNAGTYLWEGEAGSLIEISRKGQTVPDGNGVFLTQVVHAFNDVGQVAFSAVLTGTSGGFSDNLGIFASANPEEPAVLHQFARQGQPPPEGDGVFAGFSHARLNNAGQVGFRATLQDTALNHAIYRADPGLPPMLSRIVRTGRSAPEGEGIVLDLDTPSMNDSGEMAFLATIGATPGQFSEDQGIFLTAATADPENGVPIAQIIRRGDAAPDGDGSFVSMREPVLNNSGQVAFAGVLSDSVIDEGVYRATAVPGSLMQIVRTGQAAPDGNGAFEAVSAPALNNAGQIAFVGELTGTSGGFGNDDRGLYFYDDHLGLLQVARLGDAFLGSTIGFLNFAGGFASNTHRGGLNDAGQVAFGYILHDGQSGIAVFTPPHEPSLSPFDQWRTLHFTAEELADETISGIAATPAGDGIENLTKYLLGFAPKVPARGQLPQPEIVDGELRLTYPRAKAATDGELIVEVSFDLFAWHSGEEYIEIMNIADGGAFELIAVRVTGPASNSDRAFLRLRARIMEE